MLIGSFVSYIFADRIGRKKSLCIIIPIHILSLLTFELTYNKILGKKFKYALYFLYFNIFFKGLSSRIVMILLIIYICDIINQKDIPLFINIILAGTPISEFLSSFTFTFVDINWRHILAFDGFVNIFLFILFLILVI
jgi:MFS family permease